MAASTTLQPESTVVAGEHFIHFAPVGTPLKPAFAPVVWLTASKNVSAIMRRA